MNSTPVSTFSYLNSRKRLRCADAARLPCPIVAAEAEIRAEKWRAIVAILDLLARKKLATVYIGAPAAPCNLLPNAS